VNGTQITVAERPASMWAESFDRTFERLSDLDNELFFFHLKRLDQLQALEPRVQALELMAALHLRRVRPPDLLAYSLNCRPRCF
jgi:hypothetical protein